MNPLHIPLATLPGPVPVGCPVYHPKYGSGVLSEPDEGGEYAAVFTCHEVILDSPHVVRAIVHACNMPGVCADLTPPPIDADGHPTRIDALPILVDMLARAMGHPEGQYTFMPSATLGAWNLRTFIDGPVRRMSSTFRPDGVGATTTDETYQNFPAVPALASVPLTDPTATRLALAALFATRVWETA